MYRVPRKSRLSGSILTALWLAVFLPVWLVTLSLAQGDDAPVFNGTFMEKIMGGGHPAEKAPSSGRWLDVWPKQPAEQLQPAEPVDPALVPPKDPPLPQEETPEKSVEPQAEQESQPGGDGVKPESTAPPSGAEAKESGKQENFATLCKQATELAKQGDHAAALTRYQLALKKVSPQDDQRTVAIALGGRGCIGTPIGAGAGSARLHQSSRHVEPESEECQGTQPQLRPSRPDSDGAIQFFRSGQIP